MEWWLLLLIMFGCFIVLLLSGLPVAIAFLAVNTGACILLWNGHAGLRQLILSIDSSISTFVLLPIPLFILMGEMLFHTGIGYRVIDVIDKLMGRIPGRLGLVAVSGGTLFSTLSGSTYSTCAMLGALLVPEMEKRGYKTAMSIGPIIGSGGLAMMIPPSAGVALMGVLAKVSVGEILMAGILPGLLMASLYVTYIVVRCSLQPSLAPPYEAPQISLWEKISLFMTNIFPFGIIIFMVIGLILLGIAAPSEAAAMGAFSTFILAACYRSLTWENVKNALNGTSRITIMILIIVTGSTAFSQILSFSGALRTLTVFATELPVAPIVIIIAMQLVVIFMGCFVDAFSIMMITLPVFTPVVRILGFDPVWFCILILLNLQMGNTTPPFGMLLFVMKGVAPLGTKMADIYKAALPFLGCDTLAMILIMLFPIIALWIPSLMM